MAPVVSREQQADHLPGLAGQKHPALMGQSYKIAWAEIWDEVKEVFSNARMTGQATMKDDDCLFVLRNGFLEETYFSWSIIPMVGEDGTVTGLYNPAFEKVNPPAPLHVWARTS